MSWKIVNRTEILPIWTYTSEDFTYRHKRSALVGKTHLSLVISTIEAKLEGFLSMT